MQKRKNLHQKRSRKQKESENRSKVGEKVFLAKALRGGMKNQSTGVSEPFCSRISLCKFSHVLAQYTGSVYRGKYKHFLGSVHRFGILAQ